MHLLATSLMVSSVRIKGRRNECKNCETPEGGRYVRNVLYGVSNRDRVGSTLNYDIDPI